MTPLPIVAELPALSPPGARVLDVGAGDGRNAIFLAERGFSVEALERWPALVNDMNEAARTRNLPLRAAVHDVNASLPSFGDYDIVVCTLVLHLLDGARGGGLLAAARAGAAPGAVHAIATITSEGDFARERTSPGAYYPSPGEVAGDYERDGWAVDLAIEEEIRMREARADGSPKHNVVSFVLARNATVARSQ